MVGNWVHKMITKLKCALIHKHIKHKEKSTLFIAENLEPFQGCP